PHFTSFATSFFSSLTLLPIFLPHHTTSHHGSNTRSPCRRCGRQLCLCGSRLRPCESERRRRCRHRQPQRSRHSHHYLQPCTRSQHPPHRVRCVCLSRGRAGELDRGGRQPFFDPGGIREVRVPWGEAPVGAGGK
ncbi:hypothetical protein C8R45DRAFT_1207733, partial [Mycena sanguinolenta]